MIRLVTERLVANEASNLLFDYIGYENAFMMNFLQSTADDDCGDPEVLALFLVVMEEIEASTDELAKTLLADHMDQIEKNMDMSNCQKDPRRQSIIDMWTEWGTG